MNVEQHYSASRLEWKEIRMVYLYYGVSLTDRVLSVESVEGENWDCLTL